MKWWKWLGLAGVAGVTATGVVIARDERRRRSYAPDEIRTRLHVRLSEAADAAAFGAQAAGPAPGEHAATRRPGRRPRWVAPWRRRGHRPKFANLLRRGRR